MIYTPEFVPEASAKKTFTVNEINKAIEAKTILSSLVISCDDELTLEVSLAKNITGYIKFEDVEYRFDGARTKEIAALSKVGSYVQFIPTNITTHNGRYIVECSRKLAQKECYDNFISKLVPGDIIDARITSIENYGVFCDIGCGIIALLPTKLISVTHIINPKELLADMSRLKVVIRKIKDDGKIELTHRELLGTWKQEASKLSEGSTVIGTVLSIEDYGVFVRLSQNLSGLAKVPEGIDLTPGDVVVVHVHSITEDTLKVKLSIVRKVKDSKEELRFNYYINDKHIDVWTYADTKKLIQTDFNNIED